MTTYRFIIILQIVSFVVILLLLGCSSNNKTSKETTITQLELFQNIEAYLPILPDSIIARYQRYDSTAFRKIHQVKLSMILNLVDSLNKNIPEYLQIDTLSIDHSFNNIIEAGRKGKTIYISSSYFIIYDDISIFRYIIFHEYGHLIYELLDGSIIDELETIWRECKQNALLYLFHDAEYSGNARFGGHPNESAEEMFASAFNILNNKKNEFHFRLKYVDVRHLGLMKRLEDIISRH